MPLFAISLLLGLAAALADVLGGLLLVRVNWPRRRLRYFVALGAGFILAAALLEMVPESFRLSFRWTPLLIFGGYCAMHLLRHTMTAHVHLGKQTDRDEFLSRASGNSVAGGLAVHSLFDGVAIASGFAISHWLGWVIFTAILLHKVPEGFTVASVMLASGRSRRAAFVSAVFVACATLAGVLIINWLPGWARVGLPLAAGVAIYVGATDLVPAVNQEPGIRMALVFFGGVALFILFELFAHGSSLPLK